MTDIEVTKVIFRKWSNGDVIAFFPEIPSSCLYWYHCLSYEHIGQHGGANYEGCVFRTKLAKPEEYQELKQELEALDYNLKVYQRQTPEMRQTRENEFNRIMKGTK